MGFTLIHVVVSLVVLMYITVMVKPKIHQKLNEALTHLRQSTSGESLILYDLVEAIRDLTAGDRPDSTRLEGALNDLLCLY